MASLRYEELIGEVRLYEKDNPSMGDRYDAYVTALWRNPELTEVELRAFVSRGPLTSGMRRTLVQWLVDRKVKKVHASRAAGRLLPRGVRKEVNGDYVIDVDELAARVLR